MGPLSRDHVSIGDLKVLIDSIMIRADDLKEIRRDIKDKASLCMKTLEKFVAHNKIRDERQ